jgi:hypothetical protein
MVDMSVRKPMPGLAYPAEYLKRLAAELSDKYAGIFGTETVERDVLESYTALFGSAAKCGKGERQPAGSGCRSPFSERC